MKMGTIRSPCPYDAAARHPLQSANLRRPTISRYASWVVGPISQGGPVTPPIAAVPINPEIDVMGQKATSEEDRRAEPALTGYRRSGSPGYATALPQDFGGGKSSAIG
jgi:hypothetical protein